MVAESGFVTLRSCRMILLLTVVYAFYQGWTDVFFIGEVIYTPDTGCNVHQAFILFRTVGFFVGFVWAARLECMANRNGVCAAILAFMLASALAIVLSGQVPSLGYPLQFFGAAFGGMGIGLISLAWFELVTLLSPELALASYLLAAIVAPALITPLYSMGYVLLAVCGFVLPVLSVLVLAKSAQFAEGRSAVVFRMVEKRLFVRMVVLLALFGFALAFREPLIGNNMFDSGSYTALGSLATALVIAIGFAVWGRRFRLSFVCRVLLPVTAVVFLLMPTRLPFMDVASNTCGSACDELVKILSAYVIIWLCWNKNASPLRLFGLAYGVHGVLVFLGRESYLALASQGLADADISMWFSVIAAIVIAVTLFILPSSQDLAKLDGSEAETSKQEREAEGFDAVHAAQALAGEFGLTAREIEVLALILEGKSIDEIATELVVARETAKTHRRNLLLKCGVRSDDALKSLAHRP